MTETPIRLEPRWPAMVALLAVGGLRLALPSYLSVGPDWLLIAIVGVLLIPTVWAHYHHLDLLNKVLGYIVTSVVTIDMIWSLGLLIAALPSHKQQPQEMLISAAALWITNVLVFASWYWRLDAGGPRARELRGVHTDGAFLAFNTSTAFSPTDSPVLSRWAKMMMMVQSLISFTTVALLAARAVNIL
jgi:hypothetical protein